MCVCPVGTCATPDAQAPQCVRERCGVAVVRLALVTKLGSAWERSGTGSRVAPMLVEWGWRERERRHCVACWRVRGNIFARDMNVHSVACGVVRARPLRCASFCRHAAFGVRCVAVQRVVHAHGQSLGWSHVACAVLASLLVVFLC